MEYAATGRLQGELIVTEVCKLYGWDYWTYLAQPQWFLTLIYERLKIEAKRAEAEAQT